MDPLVRLRLSRAWLAHRVAGMVRAGGDVRFPALDKWHSLYRDAGVAQPWRRLPSLSTQHIDADSVVSEEERSMNTYAAIGDEFPQEQAAAGLIGLAERGRLPDALLRQGIRRMCAQRLRGEMSGGMEQQAARFAQRIDMLRNSPVAIHTQAANAQHYE